MSKYFDYTISVYMDDNPVLCDQDFAMGSNAANFLRPKLNDGLVERYGIDDTIAYLPLEDEDEHFKMIIDYSQNDARAQGLCGEDDAQKDEQAKPTNSRGILLVAEADNATNNGIDLDAFKSTLGALGMTILETASIKKDKDVSSLFIGMEEGYIAAHSYQKSSSIGLEILLWSKLIKQDDVLHSLLGVVGVDGKSYSSYRVIHGGMNGHKKWKEESQTIGPLKKNVRNCDNADDRKATDDVKSSGEHFSAVVSESLSQLLKKKGEKTVAVLCGNDCETLNSLKEHQTIDRVIAIWACPESADRATKDDDSGYHVYACGQEHIYRSAKLAEGYSALIVDPAASDSFVDIGREIFCNKKISRSKSHPLLRDHVVFATLRDTKSRSLMFERCLRYISKRLNRSGTVLVENGTEVGLVATNDGFVRHLVTVSDNIKQKMGLSVEIEKIKSGPVPFQQDFDPLYHSASAYDQLAALEQYTKQTPLASQSIYQLEVTGGDDVQKLSPSFAKEVLDLVSEGSEYFATSDRRYFDVGDGSVAVALTSTGHIIVTWNGAGLYTINILTEGEKYERVKSNGEATMVLTYHKRQVVDVVLSKLPASTTIIAQEQMPRGANKVVNFKYDIDAVDGCADHYEICKRFAKNGRCDAKKYQPWMNQYCSLSCGVCGEVASK